jgi:tryptophanyl-tRNA synthetase
VEVLEPLQARYREVRVDPAELHRLLAGGADKARDAGGTILELMYERMGFARS